MDQTKNNSSPQKTKQSELVKMVPRHESENSLPLIEEVDLQSHPFQKENQTVNLNTDEKEVNQNNVLKGLQKYFRQDGDYFLVGATVGDASKSAHEDNLQLQKEQEGLYKQDTLMGVFFPVMQNILGVLLFIRVPEITGESGIRDSSLIVFVCVLTTFLTTLSLSAIATNGKIKSGGTYYIISRSLGAPIGTALGTCFYLGNTFAGAMYILGAVEAFLTASGIDIGGKAVNMRVFGTILWFILVSINYVGIKYVAKFGTPVLMVVLVSIVSMYLGIFIQTEDNARLVNEEQGLTGINQLSMDNCNANNDPAYHTNSFFVLLSIYFPSVTGIMAGSNRSGDLKDPSRNIPKGTLGAQFLTSVIYLSFPILFGCVCDRTTLQRRDVLIAAEVAWPTPWLVAAGIILSSTGAGMQSLASAPRLMYAISSDENLPCLIHFKGNEKRNVILSGIICFCAIMVGEINDINPIITMFFLLCYAGVNFCTIFMDLLAFPNWRPSWRYYSVFTSFIAVCLCLFLMIAISWWAFLVAIGLAAILFTIVIYNRKPNENYGDSISSVKLKMARSNILGLQESQNHVKNYIPICLVLGEVENDNMEALGALHFLRTIRDDTCLTIYGSIVKSTYSVNDKLTTKKVEKIISDKIKEHKFLVVPQIIQSDNVKQGNIFLMQGAGLGTVEPNLIVLPFPNYNYKEQFERAQDFVGDFIINYHILYVLDIISQAIHFDKAVIISKPDKEFINDYINEGNIDLWSFSYEKGLMILLTFFMTRSKYWSKCKFRLFIVVIEPEDPATKKDEEQEVKDKILTFLARYRLKILKEENVYVIFLKPQDIKYYVAQDIQSQLKKSGLTGSENPMEKFNEQEVLLQKNEKSAEGKSVQTNQSEQSIINIGMKKAVKELSVLTSNQTENLNKIITTYSAQSDLVITNLPDPMSQTPSEYLDFLNMLTLKLKRVILMRNDAQHVITEFT